MKPPLCLAENLSLTNFIDLALSWQWQIQQR